MFKANTALWEKYAPLVKQVEKPSRYLGQEWGAIEPADKPDADYHAVMIYPDTYEIGQANQAISILYDELNADERIYCERAYLPWVDMIALMRERGRYWGSCRWHPSRRSRRFARSTSSASRYRTRWRRPTCSRRST